MCLDLALCFKRVCSSWCRPLPTNLDTSNNIESSALEVPSPEPVRGGLSAGAQSSSTSRFLVHQGLIKISDCLYEVGDGVTSPSIEFVFFHGLQLTRGDEDVFSRTWTSEDNSALWPKWLREYFPGARILITSYDAWAQKNSTQGRFDLLTTGESLLTVLMGAEVGGRGCPVILVGHDIGCLVLKEVCYQAHLLSSLDRDREKIETLNYDFFLQHIRGMFYFSPPSLGTEFADQLLKGIESPGPWLEMSETLSDTAIRLGEYFRKMRGDRYKHWETWAVGETQPVDLEVPLESKTTAGPTRFRFNEVVVKEGSSRYDVDKYLPISADHNSISRPSNMKSLSFDFLASFAKTLYDADSKIVGRDFHSRCDVPTTFGLEGALQELEGRLSLPQDQAETKYIGFAGMGGIGKTTLAKSFLQKISSKFEYTCVLDLKLVDREISPEILKRTLLTKMFRHGLKIRIAMGWSELERKKVLILLDGAEVAHQILDRGTNHGFGPGSCVMATSRDRSILAAAGYEIYDVKKLSKECSEELFKHTFKRTEYINHEYALKLVRMCGGLPLALKEVSKYLCSCKDERVWEATMKRVSDADDFDGRKDNPLWASLDRSFTALAEREKRMFVDLATCFYNEEVAEVTAAWDALYSGIGDQGCLNLLSTSLAKCSGDFGSISLVGEHSWFSRGTRLKTKHKLLKYLGERKSRQKINGHYEQGRRVHAYNRGTANKLLKLARRTPNNAQINPDHEIRIMKIDRWEKEWGEISVDLISCFPKLKVLWLKEGVCLPSGKVDSKTLKIESLFWRQNEGLEISRLIQSDLLRHLNFKQSPILPCESLSCYQELKHLVLNSFPLGKLPDCLGNLKKLEHLEISDCPELKSLPSSFTSLVNVKRLFLIGLKTLSDLPESFEGFRSLKQIELRNCSGLETFQFLETLQSIEHLALEGLRLQELTYGSAFCSLKFLELRDCLELRSLPSWLESPELNLQHLQLVGLANLRQDSNIPDKIVKCLKTLEIRCCPALQIPTCKAFVLH